jgi:predicted nucleic acid-binding protein
MIVLDTNIVSELSSLKPNPLVFNWAAKISIEHMFLCTPVVAELAFGAELLQRRTGSDRHSNSLDAFLKKRFLGRVLPFGLEAALLAGAMRAKREATGRPVKPMDMAIAAITKSNNATLATRNTRDFEGLDLKLINPFEA